MERSGPRPKWVNGLEKEYIIVVGTGATIELAQQQALMAIKESIVEAVAVNVKKDKTNKSNLHKYEIKKIKNRIIQNHKYE